MPSGAFSAVIELEWRCWSPETELQLLTQDVLRVFFLHVMCTIPVPVQYPLLKQPHL